MKKTFKIVALLVFVLVTSTFVFAQASNTLNGSAGTLRDDADNFMDVRYYNEVDFSNFFVWTNLSASSATLGYAKKFDNLYLGTYYNGSLWNGSSSTKTTTSDSTSLSKTVKGTHYFDLLFGFSGMALKFDTYFNTNNSVTESTNYITDKKNSNSVLGLTFGGFSISSEKLNIKPWARVGFSILDQTEYSKVEVNIVDSTITTTETDKSSNLNLFSVKLAADFESGDKYSFFSVFGLAYTLNTAVGANGIIYESVTGTETTTVEREGLKYNASIIAPSYRFEYNASENLKLAGRVRVNADITTVCGGNTYITGAKPEEMEALTVSTTTEITSNLGLGMQYILKPNFAMNVGLYAVLPEFNSTKTVTPVGDSKSTTVTSGVDTSFSSSLRTGFVWDINENCALDAYTNIGLTPSFLDSVLGGSLSLGFKYKK